MLLVIASNFLLFSVSVSAGLSLSVHVLLLSAVFLTGEGVENRTVAGWADGVEMQADTEVEETGVEGVAATVAVVAVMVVTAVDTEGSSVVVAGGGAGFSCLIRTAPVEGVSVVFSVSVLATVVGD